MLVARLRSEVIDRRSLTEMTVLEDLGGFERLQCAIDGRAVDIGLQLILDYVVNRLSCEVVAVGCCDDLAYGTSG